MRYFSEINRPETIPAPSGDKWRTKYKRTVDENGNETQEEAGKTNVYETIQAAKESTLIYNIIDRFENGDVNTINKLTKPTEGFYIDATELPTNIHEANEIANQNQVIIQNLPEELKNKVVNNGNLTEEDFKNYYEQKFKREETTEKVGDANE